MACLGQNLRPPKRSRGGMKILASLIKHKLERQVGISGYCFIYEYQLQRLWPLNGKNRRAKIAAFAKEYGFRLSVYKPGVCAIFEKEPDGK
jgi:hypothetical protein